MYKTTNEGLPTPTANIAINNSRIKLYGKNSEDPTYYLQKGQEFQIELHNPTKDTIMAKISLNGKPIAQGGLVLKPAQRVFLDRYIDVAKKFKFDTYEVTNSVTNQKAIEDNGDFRVEFYKEQTPINYNPIITLGGSHTVRGGGGYFGGNVQTYYNNTTNGAISANNTLGLTGMSDARSTPIANTTTSNYSADNVATLDAMDFNPQPELKKKRKTLRSKKSVETGRVEAGSKSDQELTTVYMTWEQSAFHSIEYKMLPVSQKVNTVQDISVKRYCTNCGGKNKTNFKFCPSCGTRV